MIFRQLYALFIVVTSSLSLPSYYDILLCLRGFLIQLTICQFTEIYIMKIIFNSEENVSLSKNQREKILALIQSQGVKHVEFSLDVESQKSLDKSESLCFLSTESLLDNLAELQSDALVLEEQVSSFKERNDYLEEKINWLRTKAGESGFVAAKVKRGASLSSHGGNLHSALAQVINKMESKAHEGSGLSFSRSKRARKDKALISKSEYFDEAYVVSELQNLGLEVKDPLDFFASFGAELEISPSEKFDTKAYLSMNPDVKESGINPLLHYIKHGKSEGRVLI